MSDMKFGVMTEDYVVVSCEDGVRDSGQDKPSDARFASRNF
jgi:hypothetical protein